MPLLFVRVTKLPSPCDCLSSCSVPLKFHVVAKRRDAWTGAPLFTRHCPGCNNRWYAVVAGYDVSPSVPQPIVAVIKLRLRTEHMVYKIVHVRRT